MSTPNNCFFLKENPKTSAPKINVFSGVNEVRIDAMEESIFSIANANKNAGKNVPNKPFNVR